MCITEECEVMKCSIDMEDVVCRAGSSGLNTTKDEWREKNERKGRGRGEREGGGCNGEVREKGEESQMHYCSRGVYRNGMQIFWYGLGHCTFTLCNHCVCSCLFAARKRGSTSQTSKKSSLAWRWTEKRT